MQQPAAAPVVELVRWQTATLVASAVAAVELVVVIVLGLALLTGPASDAVREPAAAEAANAPAAKPRRTAPPAPAKRQRAVATLSRGKTSILILNGNGVSGAAAATSARVQGAGYRVSAVGNAARTDYDASIVMYRKGRQGEAERFARDLGVELVAPLDGMRPRDLGGAHVVLVVGGS